MQCKIFSLRNSFYFPHLLISQGALVTAVFPGCMKCCVFRPYVNPCISDWRIKRAQSITQNHGFKDIDITVDFDPLIPCLLTQTIKTASMPSAKHHWTLWWKDDVLTGPDVHWNTHSLSSDSSCHKGPWTGMEILEFLVWLQAQPQFLGPIPIPPLSVSLHSGSAMKKSEMASCTNRRAGVGWLWQTTKLDLLFPWSALWLANPI